jgi:hypothetical protein
MPLKMNYHVLFVHEQGLWQGPEDLRKDKNPLELSAAEFRVATTYMHGIGHPFDLHNWVPYPTIDNRLSMYFEFDPEFIAGAADARACPNLVLVRICGWPAVGYRYFIEGVHKLYCSG